MKIPILVYSVVFSVAVCSAGTSQDKAHSSEPEILVLPPLEVRDQGTSDFGLSLLSNRNAALGAKVEWLIVSHVVPRSGAADAGLKPGDRILRVNGGTVSKLTKDRMLALFFRRKIGTRIQLDVQDPNTDVRRTVDIVCNEVHMENRPTTPPASVTRGQKATP